MTFLRHIMSYFAFGSTHPYNVQLIQQLKPADHLQHCRYLEWVLEQQWVRWTAIFRTKFSSAINFTLDGYVNKQNCRIWGSENPQVIEERPLHLKKVTVWCALWSEGVIGPYFLENDDGMTVTVKSEHYGHMITDFYCLLLKNTTWRICGFNKTVTHATQLERYGFIARDISWPLNISSWRYQLATKIVRFYTISVFCRATRKTVRIYADKPSTLYHLKTNIREVMAEMPPNMCQKVIENYLKLTTLREMLNVKVFHTYIIKKIKKKYFICVLFTFTFETTEWITRYKRKQSKFVSVWVPFRNCNFTSLMIWFIYLFYALSLTLILSLSLSLSLLSISFTEISVKEVLCNEFKLNEMFDFNLLYLFWRANERIKLKKKAERNKSKKKLKRYLLWSFCCCW